MDLPNTTEYITRIKRIPYLDTEFAIENLGGSEALYEKLLKRVIRFLPSNIAAMDNQLYEDCDIGSFGVKAHGMKSTLNQVGCGELAMLAEKLEHAAKRDDKDFCKDHYGLFKDKILSFYEQVNVIAQETGDKIETANIPDGIIGDYYDTLKQTMAAVNDYDSVSAARSLSSLERVRFGVKVDLLVQKAIAELEAFRPRKAAPFIAELLDACGHED